MGADATAAMPLPPARRTIGLLARATAASDPGRTIAAAALVIAGQCWSLAAALAVSRVVNAAGRPGGIDAIESRTLGALLALALLIRLAARPPLATVIYSLRERAAGRIERRIVELTSALPGIDHLERPELLDRIALLQASVGSVGYAIGSILEAAATLLQLAVTAALLGAVHPAALLLLAVALVPCGTGMLKNRYRRELDVESGHFWRAKKGLRIVAWAPENGPDLRLAGAGDTVRARQNDAVLALRRAHDRWAIKAGAAQSLGDIVFGAGMVILVAFLADRVAAGEAAPGDLVLALVLGQRLAGHVAQVIERTTDALRLVRTLSVLTWLEDAAAAAIRPPGTSAPPAKLTAGIEVRGVTFTYPGTGRPVLHDIDLVLRAGQRVALVGENGAGKTTLVNLLCGFHQPSSGTIVIDRTPLVELDQIEWQRRVAAVFQEATRLEVDAATSIGVGDLSDGAGHAGTIPAAPQRVSDALGRAGLADVVAGLPEGLDTRLGRRFPNGAELSGGEWQKVAHARSALRQDPLLFVLDEPTAALDAQAERDLFDRIRTRPGAAGAVTLFVSHRFSTVRDADHIVVLAGGRVVEQGTHDELIALHGHYAALYNRQARHYT